MEILFFDQTVKNYLRTYDSIVTDQQDYNFSKKYHKMIAIDLWKLQAVDTNAIQKISFLGILDHPAGEKYVLHYCRAKCNCFKFFIRIHKSILISFFSLT